MDDVDLYEHFNLKSIDCYQLRVHELFQVFLDSSFTRSINDKQFVNEVFCCGLLFGYAVEMIEQAMMMNIIECNHKYTNDNSSIIKM